MDFIVIEGMLQVVEGVLVCLYGIFKCDIFVFFGDIVEFDVLFMFEMSKVFVVIVVKGSGGLLVYWVSGSVIVKFEQEKQLCSFDFSGNDWFLLVLGIFNIFC